jgi:hypothetical protein
MKAQTKKDVQGISHLKQLSKLGVHLRHMSHSNGQQVSNKLASDINNFENLALEMDLQLHENKKVDQSERNKVQQISYNQAIANAKQLSAMMRQQKKQIAIKPK